MKNILLVENSPELLKTMASAFKKYESQLALIVAENGKEAVRTLEETAVSVLVTDLYVPEVDFPELLACLSRRQVDTPIIMTSFGSPELTGILADLSIHHILGNPFNTDELLQAVSEAINKTRKGAPPENLSLNGYLRLLQDEQRSCTLEVVDQDNMRGRFHLLDGRLHDAECDDLRGEEAAIRMLGWRKISLELKELENREDPARIATGLKALIAKAEDLRKKSAPEKQSSQGKGKDPKEIVRQAVEQAESGHSRPAYKILASLLKANPKNSRAWLWLARTSENLKTIDVSLKNAATIAPGDPEIKGDIKKLESAINSGCGEAGSLKHCPFCWAPVIKDKTSCHYCQAHLDIHEDFFHSMFFSSKNEPDLKIIEEASQRFNRAKTREPNNLHPYFFLALAHINLNHWEEALGELKRTEELAPGSNPYHRQLEILIDFMNDLNSFFSQDDEGPE
ncbi:MAG: response regulator [Desulfurivibrionaceae bacterium]|nr:response regulator [Desulfurivibrionaceae bacterium]